MAKSKTKVTSKKSLHDGKPRSTKALSLPQQKDYPKEIYCTNEVYRLLFVKDLPGYGVTDWAKKTIKIKKGISPRETFKTFVHEVLHVIEFEYGIKIKHKTIYALEPAIVEVILDNGFL